ncbi:MAG: TIGR03759 family integrating conjugative element protein [Candidatus Thiodiazotropha endolucinida]|nr:TIGR03759 family integrating conjugative element protein [Candidatus Thiodiazotropha taylori]MCG7953142.1 TIGR03759 family integrating conjugative element protein [Candidatus Thiodiazotropha taylori]MCG8096738.1 TIGR03759 family integrating conjugative element protein [Candidatus Thiodiazotropha endolucinida]MCW4268568.1 TIGR03759 family integrating conjugative element protein [Candidatus Thiodiazotropha endolucinida]MCW4270860.1 TIGR03759 family integrating conjugative element protein [Cand
MNSRLKSVVLSIVLVASYPAVAATVSQTQVKETGQDASLRTTNTLSATERSRARLWELSETEWRRYKQLMQGIRGSISPSTISPIEVLGIHARDDAERRRYAEAWARAMYEDAGRILAFQRAYDAATKQLYPNELLIDINRLPEKTEPTSALQSTDRLLFFARPECPACDLLMGKLMKRLDEVRGIDIYLTGIEPGDDAAVRAWASTHAIDPGWVRNRRITLNHDGGALERLTRGQGEVPTLLRRRGEDLSPIRAADL